VSIDINRRDWISLAGGGLAAASASRAIAGGAPADSEGPSAVVYGLNTSTISGQKLPLAEVYEIAAKAGYGAVEPWLREIEQHIKGGAAAADLRKRASDLNLTIPSAIGFFDWCVDDDARRAKALEQARRDMDLVRQIGGTRIAAPPSGAADGPSPELGRIAERYRTLLELGERIGVTPIVELWGFSKTLGRLGEVAQVAIGADHPKAAILLDVYHIHRGGSGFDGLGILAGSRLPILHMNDYPGGIAPAALNDSDRVYPGRGAAPLPAILRTLRSNGFCGVLSLELFNREYWSRDAAEVARLGLESMQAAVKASLE